MEAIARAWKTAVRTALPGPWRPRRVVGEAVAALLMGGFTTLVELVSDGVAPVLFGIAVALLWVLRKGLPAGVLVVTAALAGCGAGPMAMLVCAGWTAGARIRRVWSMVAAFVVGWVLFTASGVVKDAITFSPKLVLPLSLGLFLVLAVLPALYGRYRAQRRALLDALRERNEQLLRERVMVVHQARLRERHRIAQDMHDSLGHQLALISVHSGALEVDRTLSDRQREAVGVLRQAAVAAMRELREVVGVLHDESTAVPPATGPVTAAGTPARGGVDGVEGLVESSRAAGAEVDLVLEGERRPLSAAVDHAAYRIVQEALTNAHKHAPGAPIGVALRYEPDALVVEVTNARAPELVGARAVAGAAVSGGQGLTGLRERARLTGGMVHAGPTPEQGFRLAAVLPYEGAEQDAAADGAEDWVVDGLPPVEEPKRGRRSPAMGCAVGVVAIVVIVLGLLVWGVIAFVQSTNDATLQKPMYDQIRVGTAESEVLQTLPRGSDFITDTYKGTGPEVPEGAHCRWYVLSGAPGAGWNEDHVARFCFRDGALVEKQEYVARG
ncbi:histidine kinase [Kitasatospora sp. NPDC036755]|uniref:sensor histidine kinase n=1 Tax=Kitasatospora sp. NPDC036755 TaxID=3154600 RepID=UPI0033F4D234